jgi:hypothetical protein
MRWISLLLKLLAIAAGITGCALLARKFGSGMGLVLWVAISGLACGATALAMRAQAMGKVTIINFIAGMVLQWGYRVGRGKLPAIIAVSWCIWVLLGTAVVIAINAQFATSTTASPNATASVHEPISILMMSLLVAAWIVDGAALLWVTGILLTSGNRSGQLRSLGPIMAILLAIIAGSALLILMHPSAATARTALLIAGGPPLVVGVGYGLFIILILSTGRGMRN